MREMKDSGIEGIGEIPSDWKLSYLQYYADIVRGGSPRPIEKYMSDTEEGYNWIKIGDTTKGCRYITSVKEKIIAAGLTKTRRVSQGDLLLTNSMSFGEAYILQVNGCIHDGWLAFSNLRNIDKNYLYYYLISDSSKVQFEKSSDGGVVQNLNIDKVKHTYICIPQIDEQKKIADFLDKKCAEIDILTSDIQKQIDTLEQYKKSVITEAVTKGLNPDAEMKDSGVDWIGDIPSDWETIKIGRLFSIRNERNTKPMDEVQLLSLYTGIGVFPHGEQEERGNKAVTVEGYKIVHKNDIVVNIILAWMGAIGISEYDGVTSPAYDIYVPDTRRVIPHFYHYVFRTKGIAGECYKYGRGIMLMRWRTYAQEFKQISVPFPSIETQQEIADYLDKKCSEIDTIISDKKKQLEVITEYKKSLIYEYVTGKKEVM
jgi:type I restriction enzyme S subunit